MGDQKISQTNRNHFEIGPNERVDLFLRSESPRIQQILLHQKLKEEIEKNSNQRVRYVDSKLYLKRNQSSERSTQALINSAHEIQSTTLNVGLSNSSTKLSTSSTSPSNIREPSTSDRDHLNFTDNDDQQEKCKTSIINKNCQVCLLKEVRQDLMNITKLVQERNEQITKLKARCLKSYLEHQLLE